MSDVSSNSLISFSGIESGLDTQAIISAYLDADEAPLVQLQNEQSADNADVSDYQTIQQELQSLQSAASAVSAPDAFASAVSASSTNSAVATASTGPGAVPGSATFSIDQLATADTLVSSGTVASPNDVVASGDLLVGAGGSGLGIASLAGSGLASGAHTIAVTQASAGATVIGATPVAASTTITAANNQLSVSIDGTPMTFTLADGTYGSSELAAAVTAASSGLLTASVDSAGDLMVATSEQGSQATLQIGSDSANTALGLSGGGTVSGTDGVITVDGQANTVTDIAATGTTSVSFDSGSGGTVEALLTARGLSVGSLSAENVSVGDGSLSSVVDAINSADVGVTAEALQVGANEYALAVSADATGSGNDVAIDPSAFSGSGLGTLTTTTAGQDAIVSLGGPGGYQVRSTSNTLSGLLPGVDISLQDIASSPVTITVGANGQAAASVVQTFVTAANTLLQSISTDTAYNQTTGAAGPLNGDFELRNLAEQVLSVVSGAIGTSNAADAGTPGSAAGLSIDASTGQIDFDATTFASDYESDPADVARMFIEGGTFSPASGSPAGSGDVSLAYASDGTAPGAYTVVASQSATQASDIGTTGFASGASTVGAAENYTVSSAGESASYGISAGESLNAIASGLDGAFAQADLDLSAQVVINGSSASIEITSAGYGSQASFAVSSSASDELGLDGSSFAGLDVAGTINGVAATGDGQILAAPTSDPTLAGLSLMVATAGITSSTTLGSFDYVPGFGAAIANLAATSVASGGELPTKITSLQETSTQLGDQITVEQQVVNEEQQQLEAEFNNLESTLATLKSESSYLSSAFGGASSSLGSLTGDSSGSSTSGSSNAGTSGSSGSNNTSGG